MSGHHRHASETPFKWRFAGGQMAFRWRADDGTLLLVCGPFLTSSTKKNKKKDVKVENPLTKFWDPRMIMEYEEFNKTASVS